LGEVQKPAQTLKVVTVCALILLAVGIVFGQSLSHEFVNYDDDVYIYENHQVIGGLSAQGLVWAFTAAHAGNWHPLTWLSHMLDCQLYGLAPGGHHLTSLLLHAATAILLFLILFRMTGKLWPSAFVAGVFAVHPLRVESVAWVAERKDVLSGFFFMLTLGTYIGYVRNPFSKVRYFALLVAFALGLMAKPMLVTLPFVLLLLDYWPLRRMVAPVARDTDRLGVWRIGDLIIPVRLVVEKLPLLLLVLVSCVLTLWAQQISIMPVEYLPIHYRIGNALVTYVAYLGKLFLPVNLVAFYPHPMFDLSGTAVLGASLVLTAITFGVWVGRRHQPYLLVGWGWYLVTLLPVIGLVQVGGQAMADRYTYLTQIGLLIALTWGFEHVSQAWRGRVGVSVGASVLILGVLMSLAWRQTSVWQNSESLWVHALACVPRNAVAHNNLGSVMMFRGQLSDAITHYRQSLEIDPTYIEAHNNLGVALVAQGNVEQGIAQYQMALELQPNIAKAWVNLGVALALRGRTDEAIANYRKALELKPDFAAAHDYLGIALAYRGRTEEATAHYLKALELDNDSAVTHDHLGFALATLGQMDEAIVHYRKALELKPDLAEAHTHLGRALASRWKVDEAIAHYRRALELNPDFLPAYNNLASLLATWPDPAFRNGPEAVVLAREAVRLSREKDPMVLNILAAAYAEAGQFQEAEEVARRAIDLATRQKKHALVKTLQSRLTLYESGTPFHEKLPPQ